MAAVAVLLLLLAVPGVSGRVRIKSGVEVARGRWAPVTERQLQIDAGPGADCKVEVVMNEPVTQRVGRLTPRVRRGHASWHAARRAPGPPSSVPVCPQVFDCAFPDDRVKYVHNGSPQLDEDTVMLRVYRSVS